MTVEQRLAEIEQEWEAARLGDEMDKCDWGLQHAEWLLSLVRSMQAVVEAADRFVEDLGLAGWDADPRSLRAALEAYRRESEK